MTSWPWRTHGDLVWVILGQRSYYMHSAWQAGLFKIPHRWPLVDQRCCAPPAAALTIDTHMHIWDQENCCPASSELAAHIWLGHQRRPMENICICICICMYIIYIYIFLISQYPPPASPTCPIPSPPHPLAPDKRVVCNWTRSLQNWKSVNLNTFKWR